MRILVLIKQKINKTYNVLQIIKKNKNFSKSQDLIDFYNEKNFIDKFKSIANQIKNKKIDRAIIMDDDGFAPFLFFSKQKNLFGAIALDEVNAKLIRAHNNSSICIIPINQIDSFKNINKIINIFCKTKFEGGRHALRLKIMHTTMVPSKTSVSFNKKQNRTIVFGSDHAGFKLKEKIKKYLISKHFDVIDVGTKTNQSTHYSLFALAMVKNYCKANFAIGICWTGMGIANSLNKFKGIKACICTNVKDERTATSKYGMNTLVLSARLSSFENAKKIVDAYIRDRKIKKVNNKQTYIDKFGMNFSFNKFKKIKLPKDIVLPKDLK